MTIEILSVFNTSMGVAVILKFPQEIAPQMNMQLRRGNQLYYIGGIAFSQPISSEFSGINNYSCILNSDEQMDLKKGDILHIL